MSQQHIETPVAYRIHYSADGSLCQTYQAHNAIDTYRAIDPSATVTPLYERPRCPMTDQVNEAVADIKPLLEIGREAYSEVYVHVYGEDDNHYEALDAAIMAVLAARSATHPARGVVDERRLIGWRTGDYLWETAERATALGWLGNVEVLPIFEGDPNTKLQAAQPAAPSVPEGWVLVPREPTRDMLWAGGEAPANPAARLSGCQTGAVWRAMINAATLHPVHTIEFARAMLAATTKDSHE